MFGHAGARYDRFVVGDVNKNFCILRHKIDLKTGEQDEH